MKRLLFVTFLLAGCETNTFDTEDAQRVADALECVTSKRGVCVCVWKGGGYAGGIAIDPTGRSCN